MGVIPGLHAPPLPEPPTPQGLEEGEATLAESEGVGPRAVILCFRDYTTLLWMRVQPSPAQPPTCSLGLVPKPQTPASLSTRLSQTPVGPRGFMLVQKGNSLRGTAQHEAVQRWTPACPLKLFPRLL